MAFSLRTAGVIVGCFVAVACKVHPVEMVDATGGPGASGSGGSGGSGGSSAAGTGGSVAPGGTGGGGAGGTIDAGRNCSAGNITDSICAFSSAQGEDGWSYGYIEPAGDNTFHPMGEFVAAEGTAVASWYTKQGDYWTKLTAGTAHPNGTTTSGGRTQVIQYAVRRWQSSVSGTINIHVTAYKHDVSLGTNGTVARVVVDGVEVWSKMLASDDGVGLRDDVMSADVNVGSTVDLVVDPFQGDDKNDETHLSVTITR